MRWYIWMVLWLRLAKGYPSNGDCYDGHGRWVPIGFGLYFLASRKVGHPLGEPTLYKQVYHEYRNRGNRHDECVDVALEAVEAYGKFRALSPRQLNDIIEEVS